MLHVEKASSLYWHFLYAAHQRNLNEKNVEDLVVPTDSIVVGTYLYFP